MKSGIRLTSLAIQNIALADRLSLDFVPGMNLLTGETGAGKSIIINALHLCIGGRSDKDFIRSGESQAYVEAVFQVDAATAALSDALEGAGVQVEEGSLILSRELTLEGRTQCRINGRALTLSVFRRVGTALVDIHGQHGHHFLLDPANHLEFLDRLGEGEVQQARSEVAEVFGHWHKAAQSLYRMQTQEKDRRQRIDMLAFQIDEIRAAKLVDGEEEALQRQRDVIVNSEKIIGALNQTYQRLYEGSDKRSPVTDVLQTLLRQMGEASAFMEEAGSLATRIEEAYYSLEDVALEARGLRDTLEYDPGAAERLEDRLQTIFKLKRKYGGDIAAILSYLHSIEEEFEQLSNWEENLEKLERNKKMWQAKLVEACQSLTAIRKRMASGLEKRLMEELAELGMGKSVFSVRFLPSEAPEGERFTANGWDQIEFYMSTNPGEPLKPMARIASGGELSRIMLALKSIGAKIEEVPCMIFDEVDTGISGHMARVVGLKMARLAQGRQILCVTHLPQIAALADRHYLIGKDIVKDRTVIQVKALSDDQRVEEIARLSGGVSSDPVSLDHARNMISRARQEMTNG